jgi:gliding motility-associated-like protein
MNINSTKLLIALFFSSFFALKAQQKQAHVGHRHDHADEFKLPLEFDKDSLQGFNEEAAWQQAKANAIEEWRQNRIVAVLKRNYIDFKYGFSKLAPPPTVQGPCSNPGFETGTTAGWVTSESENYNSQTMLPWSNLANTQANVVGVGFDPNISTLPTVPAGGGNFALRLGGIGYEFSDDVPPGSGGNSYRASQTFTVTPANSVFIYRYAVVLNNSSPHDCDEQPFFNIRFEDCNNNNIPCGAYNVSAIGSACSSGDPNFVTSNSTGNNWSYLPWQTRAFDLTNYIGQCVNVEFTVGGCVASQGGHGAYAYIDASCSPMTLNLNGTDIPVGQTNNSFCGASTSNTLCAPPGFTYSWDGPGITGQTGQCVNTNSNGTFSVTLGIAGSSCAFNPILYSTFNSAPNPTVTASVTQPTCALPAGSATITAVGGVGAYTYSWTPTAPPSSSNTNLPTNTNYTVVATDANGCFGTTTFSVDPYPPAPDYTLTVLPSYVLSCASPSTTINFAQGVNTNVSWGGPSGAITGTNVVVTAPGTYTYVAINTVSTCSLTGSINITSSLNLPVLTSTVTQPNCITSTGSASVSVASGTAPFIYTWFPTVAVPSGTVNSNLPPGSTYTVSVLDDAGCIISTTFTVNPFSGAPSYTLVNNPLALSCSTPSTALTFAPTNTNTSTSWSGPSGSISPATSTVVTALGAGTYSYTATNTVSTCSITGTFVITADTIKPSATPNIGCNTNTITLNASSTPGINLIWGVPTTPTTTINNPGSSTATGIYTLAAINPSNGCFTTYTLATSVPQINIVTTPTTNLLTCLTTTVNATAVSTPTAPITWTSGTSTVTANQLPITANGSYTATATNTLGCTSQSVITVTTNTLVNVSINGPSIIPCTTGSITLTASSAVGGPYTYSWSPGIPAITGSVLTVTTPNIYSVIATNAVNGCTATASQPVNFDNISASFNASVYNGLTPLPVTFTNTSFSSNPVGTSYTWSFGDGNGLGSNDTTVTHVYNTDGYFPVILTAQNGYCKDTAVRYIKVELISKFVVPNVFTPNGDGKNDVFTFDALNMGEITLSIFDRWGLKMFESTSSGNVIWDGKNKSGNTVTDGTYFYIIKATGLDGSNYDLKGTINVFQ